MRMRALTFLVVGLVDINVPFYGWTLVPAFNAPFGSYLILLTNPAGQIDITSVYPDPSGVPSGTDLYIQAWIVDVDGPFGYASSDASKVTTP